MGTRLLNSKQDRFLNEGGKSDIRGDVALKKLYLKARQRASQL